MEKLRSSRYNKKSGSKFSKPNSYKLYTGKLNVPELSFQEKTILRKKIEDRRRIQKTRTIIALSIGSVFLTFAILWLVQAMQATTLTEQIVIDDNAEYQSKECTRYQAYGDEYLNKSQWYNAAFEYRISLQFTPQSEEALYRLTFSLLRLCETEQRGCDEAEKRLKDLHHTNCKPEDLKELMLRWEGIKQRMPQSEISD